MPPAAGPDSSGGGEGLDAFNEESVTPLSPASPSFAGEEEADFNLAACDPTLLWGHVKRFYQQVLSGAGGQTRKTITHRW